MPKKPIDYANSSIYKLCCRDTDITDCYIGSTTNFRSRKWTHKNSCNNENDKAYNYKVYQFIRDNGGWLNWDMILIEKVNVIDGNELRKEERKWIEQLNSTLNQTIPTRTIKEYYENNKMEKREYQKEYRENNKEIINEKKKRYYEINKVKIKEQKNEKRNKKVECPICKSIINMSGLSRHQKSKKCINASK